MNIFRHNWRINVKEKNRKGSYSSLYSHQCMRRKYNETLRWLFSVQNVTRSTANEQQTFPPSCLSCTFALCRNPNRNYALYLVQTNTANLWKWMEQRKIFLAGTRYFEKEGRNIVLKDQSAEPKTLSSVSNSQSKMPGFYTAPNFIRLYCIL